MRSTVIGKAQQVIESGQAAKCRSGRGAGFLSHVRFNAGFTLLELMIVITIIIILAAIVLPQYQRTIRTTREAVLKDDLSKMRTLLDQYATDKQKLPQALDELVAAGYMRELPKDPMTGEADWTIVTGDDPNSSEQGIVDVHSASADTSSEGTPYSEW